MVYSSDVITGQQATAAQYNALRDDIVQFIELWDTTNIKPAASATWEDWDISGIVPAGTIAVLVHIEKSNEEALTIGLRKNGSALSRIWIPLDWGSGARSNTWGFVICECDANRIIEIYGTGTAQGNRYGFNIAGYWKGIGP